MFVVYMCVFRIPQMHVQLIVCRCWERSAYLCWCESADVCDDLNIHRPCAWLGVLGAYQGLEHVEGVVIDLQGLNVQGRHLGHEVHAALALLLLQLQGDAADGTTLDALHQVLQGKGGHK